MRIKLTIAYDGTLYAGWQVQSNALSIQSVLQKAIETLVRHPISLSGSGRTDSGVHALGQTAHFDTDAPTDRLRYALNALLPPDIRVLEVEAAAPDFHARYSALGKIYHYHLHLDPTLDPMTRLYRTPIFGAFDREAFARAAQFFLGTHDFLAFANESEKGIAARDSIRTLKRLDIIEQSGGLRLEFEGDGFLYKMVRNIVGTLLDVAAKRKAPEEIALLLEGRDRRKAGATASPQGLFLMKVIY